MDFRYSGPGCRGTDPKFHAGIDFVANMSDDPETWEPQEWRWWGSVCHRCPNQPLFYNSCLSGRGICCTMSGVPAICRVGAMGWLLACRQAYVETIDLFYSNIFHVGSTVLLRFFPQLVPAPRLSRVTGLLLDLTLELFDDRLVGTARDRIEGWPAFDQITSILGSGIFGDLQALSISIYDYTPKSDPLTPKELATLERLLKNFDPAHDTSENAGSVRFWRPVLSPRGIEIPAVSSQGFGCWISRGKEEPHSFHQTSCFGS